MDRGDVLPSPFVVGQCDDSAANATIWVGNGPRSNVHHAARLEGVEEQVPKDLVECLGLLLVYATCIVPSYWWLAASNTISIV